MAAALLARTLAAVATGPRYILRCTTWSFEKWFSKYISSDNRPKQPLTAYFRFLKDQHHIYKKQNPDVTVVERAKKIAHAWRELPASEKQTYEAAAKADRQVFLEELAKYKARLTLEQQTTLKEEKRLKRSKQKAIRKKRELTRLGKPKRPRSGFNIFMSEHFQEAKGISVQAKMKNLFDEWKRLPSSQNQIYLQLAEDDKIRYENEIKSWEEQMVEVGREDVIRSKSRKVKGFKREKTVKAAKSRVKTIKTTLKTKASSSLEAKAKQSEE
uniref:Transcription factor A, mitochondrial n=1 Tax=Sphenodon punctatus TaxID=8508 RepID=A0A8D0L2Q0_SPHPU